MEWNRDHTEVVLYQRIMNEKFEQKLKKFIVDWKIRDYKKPFEKGKGVERIKYDEEMIYVELKNPYRSTVGTLLYFTNHSRPDLSNSGRELSKANKCGTRLHFVCFLRVCNWFFKNKKLV